MSDRRAPSPLLESLLRLAEESMDGRAIRDVSHGVARDWAICRKLSQEIVRLTNFATSRRLQQPKIGHRADRVGRYPIANSEQWPAEHIG